MASSSTDGWNYCCDISWTGGDKWRGTQLMVATSGFFMKSIRCEPETYATAPPRTLVLKTSDMY